MMINFDESSVKLTRHGDMTIFGRLDVGLGWANNFNYINIHSVANSVIANATMGVYSASHSFFDIQSNSTSVSTDIRLLGT